jgi:hypothetical protein
MKKRIKSIIKGLLLSFLFVFVFNLNMGYLSYQVSDHRSTGQGQTEQLVINEDNINWLVPQALAQDANVQKVQIVQEKFDPEGLVKKVAEFSQYLHRLFLPMINFFAFQTGNFLGNDYIYEGDMGGMLKKIWIVSRNVVNIIFVLILLGLALKEIFWLKEEGSDLKKNLVKFTLLLIAVNFSWLATKVVLDASNVATNVVFSIPMGVSGTGIDELITQQCDVTQCEDGAKDCRQKTTGLCAPSAIYAPADADPKNWQYMKASECEANDIEGKYYGKPDSAFIDGGKDINPAIATKEGEPENPNKTYQTKTTYCWDTVDLFKYKKNTATIYLTYGMARIQNLINSTGTESITQLTVAIILSLLIQVVFTVALMALFIALIIRMAVLWVFVAFSPLLVIFLFFNKGMEGGIGSGEGNFSIKGFMKWALVPVKVGAVFSVSFLMVTAGQAIGLKDVDFFDKVGSGGVEVTAKLLKVKSLFMGMDTIQEFIWLLVTIIILWVGVFAVLGEMPGVKIISDYINQQGTRAGKWLATTPYWAPIVPIVDPATGERRMGSIKGERMRLEQGYQNWENKVLYGGPKAEELKQLNKAAIDLSANNQEKEALVQLIGTDKAAEELTKALNTNVKWAKENPAAFKKALETAHFEPNHIEGFIRDIDRSYQKELGGASAAAPAQETEAEKDQRRKETREDITNAELAAKAGGGAGVPPPGTAPGGSASAEKGEGGK